MEFKKRYKHNTDDIFNNLLGGTPKTETDSYVKYININDLRVVENQPFKPYNEGKLQELAEDIKANGLLAPLVVRELDNGYEILAGRNRYNACKMINMQEIPCVIKEVEDNVAELILLNSNLNQRQKLLPSEKAFAYKRQIEIYKEMGNIKKLDNNSNDNRANIYIYIKLTELIPNILELVDNEKIAVRVGYNLAFLSKITQENLFKVVNENKIKIDIRLSELIKDEFAGQDVTYEEIKEFLIKPKIKKEKKEKEVVIKIKYNKISKYFNSEELREDEIEETIILALEKYKGVSYEENDY